MRKVGACQGFCGQGEWTEGNFARDTLIYALGSVSATVLRSAFADAEVCGNYEGWIRRVEADPRLRDAAERLVTAGTRDGRTTLFARGKQNEFCLLCEHSAFKALVAIGFDVPNRRVSGLCIAKFSGDMGAAIQFAQSLDRDIRARARSGPHTRFASKPLIN